jgi:hypothetical protein
MKTTLINNIEHPPLSVKRGFLYQGPYDTIVLCTNLFNNAAVEDPLFAGVVIHTSEMSFHSIGEYKSTWKLKEFSDFKGRIELEQ